MKRSEAMRGCCEDACLLCVMEEYMTKKGAQYLMWNETLKQDPNAEVPTESYERGRSVIDGVCRRQRGGKTARRVIGLVAAVILCLMLVGVTAVAVSPELRERVFQLFITQQGDYSMGDTSEAEIDPMVVYHYSAPAVPEGYTEMKEERSEDDQVYIRTYHYEDGSVIGVYLISAASNMQWHAVPEGADVQEPVVIHDFEGMYVEVSQYETIQFLLADTLRGTYVRVSGDRVSADVLRNIVEQLHYVGQ